MSMQHWTKVDCNSKPPIRCAHSSCCIAGPITGQQQPILMVVGGLRGNGEVLDDVWLLDVDKKEWSKVGMLYQIV